MHILGLKIDYYFIFSSSFWSEKNLTVKASEGSWVGWKSSKLSQSASFTFITVRSFKTRWLTSYFNALGIKTLDLRLFYHGHVGFRDLGVPLVIELLQIVIVGLDPGFESKQQVH